MSTPNLTSSAAYIERFPPVIGRAQTAQLMDWSNSHLDAMCRQGKFLPPLKLSGSKRWRVAEVLSWIDHGCPLIADWQWPLSAAQVDVSESPNTAAPDLTEAVQLLHELATPASIIAKRLGISVAEVRRLIAARTPPTESTEPRPPP